MRRIRNSNEFSIELGRIRKNYQRQYRPNIQAIRKKFTNTAENLPSKSDNSLEAHERQYLIDHVLIALNWQFDLRSPSNLHNLIPEAPIHSMSEGTTRFLDYLGLDEARNKALLIVEAKRPSSRLPLPKKNRTGSLPRGASFESLIAASLSGNTELTEEWQEWLQTLRDYSRSVQEKSGHAPRRIVTTNGDWFILFLDPDDAFNASSPSQSKIKVYKTWAEVEESSHEIFGFLEYYEILGRTPPLSLGEISFYLAPKQLDRAMFGVRLMYLEEPEFYLAPSPSIKIVPVLFIRSKNGIWFRIETQNSNHVKRVPISRNSDDPHIYMIKLQAHINDVSQLATALLAEVNAKLGTNLTCSTLVEHYANQELFEELTPVTEVSGLHKEFLIVTGCSPHYLLKEAIVADCPYHSWDNSDAEGYAANIHPVKRAQVKNPTIFVTGTQHHCSHRETMKAKSCHVTLENQERCGNRSSEAQGAFCEIWKFEQHLCCRACAFETVCTKAEAFHLPCPDLRRE